MPKIETQIRTFVCNYFIFGGRKCEFNVSANMHKVDGKNLKIFDTFFLRMLKKSFETNQRFDCCQLHFADNFLQNSQNNHLFILKSNLIFLSAPHLTSGVAFTAAVSINVNQFFLFDRRRSTIQTLVEMWAPFQIQIFKFKIPATM